MTRFLVLSFVLPIFIVGCTAQTDKRPAPKPTETALERLLANAELNLENNQLTTPVGNNALEKYRAALLQEPNNLEALDGINRIVEKYLAWARDHADQGNVSKARLYVARAESVDASHPNLAPVVTLINEREEQKTLLFSLNRSDVLNRLTNQLELDEIATQVTRTRAFVTIRAPDDASGRWIYQALNSRVPFRVEAAFEVRSAPSILLTW